MGEELQKSIETVLNGTTSKQGIAIKLLAQMVDDKFNKSDHDSIKRHHEILIAFEKYGKSMVELRDSTDKRFESLAVVSFLSTHKKMFWLIVIAIITLAGSGAFNVLTTLMR